MVDLDIKADVNEVAASLRALNIYRHRMKFNITRTVAVELRKHIRKKFRSHLSKKSGRLYRAIRYRARSNAIGDAEISVFVDSRQQYKAQTHEYGKRIEPKKGKYLYVQGENGSIRKVTSVYIPPRPFFFNEGDQFVDTKLDKSLEKAFEKELKKAWK